ncbi:MAG TPA: rod shape-determining protein [Firmicutes bacterium]|nr:rod shape-determining protein [Candidatus Fermentithermobacillaceae bacterium]
MARDIGIDLGTCTVLVFVAGKGVVLREPAIVAKNNRTDKIIAVGQEAKRMVGRTPTDVTAVRPLKKGVITEFDVTLIMLKHFLQKAAPGFSIGRPRLLIAIPASITSVERRAVAQAGREAGGGQVYLMEEPILAALGAGLDISGPRGHMIVDIGGGTSDIAVLSMNEMVRQISTRVGGDAFDEAIVRYVRRAFNMVIGESTAEQAKIAVGSAMPMERKETEIRGRNLVTGLPRGLIIDSYTLREAIDEPLGVIRRAVRQVLDSTPPELLGDIIDRGIVLTGGGALLDGLDRFLSNETGLPANVVEDPVSCVARGTEKVLDAIASYQDHMKKISV